MNCGVGIAQGMLQKIDGEKVIAYVGDSTFFHSGIPNVINAVQQNADLVLVILDNKWVAMTGHQPSPSTDIDVQGNRMKPVDIKGLLKSIGVNYIRSVNPFNIKATMLAVKDALRQTTGVRVIIAEQECALQSGRRKKGGNPFQEEYYQIEPGRCQKCNECYVSFGCPAIRREEEKDDFHYFIEEAACIRCGACRDLCPNSAITRVEIHRTQPLKKSGEAL
jgi:indolepyruvate ferredoxin oxidoreductase alpha subunit